MKRDKNGRFASGGGGPPKTDGEWLDHLNEKAENEEDWTPEEWDKFFEIADKKDESFWNERDAKDAKDRPGLVERIKKKLSGG